MNFAPALEEARVPLLRGGSIPTPALQDIRVGFCSQLIAGEAVRAWHYTRSTFGVTAPFSYGVWPSEDKCGPIEWLVGAAMFGNPAAYNVAAKYARQGERLVELRRFVLAPNMPKNSASRVLGVCLRDLKIHGVGVVLSYADPSAGHDGKMYLSVGFEHKGRTATRTHYEWKGKRYPDRNLHQVKFPFHKELRAAVESGEAKRIRVEGKHIYVRHL